MSPRTRKRWSALVVGLLAAFVTTTAAASPAGAGPGSGGARADNPWEQPCYFASVCLYEESYGKLYAWSTYDVGPTAYYYSIFNLTTGARVALCGYGTGCSTTTNVMPLPGTCHTFRAYIGGYGSSAPPAPVQRQSAQFRLCNPLN